MATAGAGVSGVCGISQHLASSPIVTRPLPRDAAKVLNDFYEFRFEPVSIPPHTECCTVALGRESGAFWLRPSNLVDDLRKLINNPAFADATDSAEMKPPISSLFAPETEFRSTCTLLS